MFFGDFQRLIYALSDRNRRNNNDELGKAVPLMQFKNRLGINVGFAGAGLHFYAEGKTRSTVLVGNIVRHRQIVSALNLVHIFKQRRGGNINFVSHSQTVKQALLIGRYFKGGGKLLLPFEQINNRIHRVGLKLLILKL